MAEQDALAKAIIDREGAGRSSRANWETLWQSCARYTLPREATFTETVTPGHERTRQILDSTAPRALELFASFLHTLMNNPAQQWFKLSVRNVERPSAAVAKWLELAEQRILTAMVKAKVYDHLHQVYLQLGSAGTSVLYTEGGLGLPFRIRGFHLKDCVLEEGEDGEIDAVFRQRFYSPRQAVQRWGEKAGEKVMELAKQPKQGGGFTGYNRQASDHCRFIHAVFPLDEPGLGALLPREIRDKEAPFASVWVNEKDAATISVGHYLEFPYQVPRWYRTADEVYGRSPAMAALPDIRMANRMKETILRGAEKLVDPPVLMPDGALLSPLRLFPGSITFTDGVVKPEPLIPPGASRIEVGNALLEQTQMAIEKAFFVPFFVDIDEKVKTATQVLQEADERNRAVSPMLMRTQSELYDRLIPRVFNILSRAGEIPDPPEDLGGELMIEYNSPLVASQRQIEGLSILRMFEALAPWHGVDPGVFDHFDPDEVAKITHRATGAPAVILRNETVIKRVRQARLQQQQQAEQMAQIEAGAGAAADLMTAAAKGR